MGSLHYNPRSEAVMKRIALVEPVVATGKSLGIFKAPESIMALAGQLEALGYQVRLFHAAVNGPLVAEIVAWNPDVVGISTMTPNFPAGMELAKLLKLWKPVPIVLGGWHATGSVQSYIEGLERETLQEILNAKSPIDYVVAGEGEEVLPWLIAKIAAGEAVEPGRGVSFYQGNEIVASSAAPRLRDLSEVASPTSTGLDMRHYRDQRTGALDMSVHFNRGCRFACAFCSTPTSYGKGVSTVPAKTAVAYMERLLEVYRPNVITFTDEDFFAHPRWVEELVTLMLEADLARRYHVVFDTFATINDLHRLERAHSGEFLGRMKRAGFNSFTIGIESFNPRVLIRYEKEMMARGTMTMAERSAYEQLHGVAREDALLKHYRKTAQAAINFAVGHGILVVGDYMLGNMGETEEEVKRGFELFTTLDNLLVAYLPVFTPYPGTGVWRNAYSSGKLPRTAAGTIDWQRFDASAGAIDVGYDIERLRNELEVEFYTSARYERDLHAALAKDPNLKPLFGGRFTYLDRLFPDNPRVRAMLVELR